MVIVIMIGFFVFLFIIGVILIFSLVLIANKSDKRLEKVCQNKND